MEHRMTVKYRARGCRHLWRTSSRSAVFSVSSSSLMRSKAGGSCATRAPFRSSGAISTKSVSRAKSSTLASSVSRAMPVNGFWILPSKSGQRKVPCMVKRHPLYLPGGDIPIQANRLLPCTPFDVAIVVIISGMTALVGYPCGCKHFFLAGTAYDLSTSRFSSSSAMILIPDE